MSKFEAHITFSKKHASIVRDTLNSIEMRTGDRDLKGWTFSQIAGDPEMDPNDPGEVFCYVTGHSDCNRADPLEKAMDTMAEIIQTAGAPYLRKKIEQIIIDHRFNQ